VRIIEIVIRICFSLSSCIEETAALENARYSLMVCIGINAMVLKVAFDKGDACKSSLFLGYGWFRDENILFSCLI